MQSQHFHKLLSRKFLQSSLIPILSIEVLLLVLYFSVNAYISRETEKTLLEEVRSTAIPIVEQSSNRVNDDLRDVARHAHLLRQETERFFAKPDLFALPNGIPSLKVGDSGALYKANQQGCGMFYAAKTKIGDKERAKAIQSEGLDPIYDVVLKSTPNLAAVYLNTWDDMNRLCPYIDKLWDTYPPNLEMSDYNFYYEADAKHNPGRKVVWTSVYLDPAGQGWMASAIVPIYKGNFLEGVLGLDITVDKMTKNILGQKLPWDASVFLVDSMGMILAMPSSVEEALGLKELKQHVYKSSVITTVEKPEEFNLTKNPDKTLAQKFAQILKNSTKISDMEIKGKEYMLAQAIVEETGWRLMFLVDKEKVVSPVTALKQTSQWLGYAVVGMMVVFYAVFFSILLVQSKNFARKIAKPVENLVSAAMKMGQEKAQENIQVEISGVKELDSLSFEFQRMQSEIRQRTEALIAEQVAREVQEHKAEVAYQIGLYESTSAHLHNVGNALAGLDGYIRGLEKVIEAAKQWPMAFSMIQEKLVGIEEDSYKEVLNLIRRLEDVQVKHAVPQLQSNLQKIRTSYTEMMASIRHQQSMFKESQAAESKLIHENFSLDQMILEIVENFRSEFVGIPVDVQLELPEITIKGHKFQIRTGLINLIKNAFEAIQTNPSEHSKVSISLERNTSSVRFKITDNGVGFDAIQSSKLFQQGYTSKNDGHGLGLHSFLMFLQSRGGSLTAESPGQELGATFVAEIVDES